MAIRFLATNLWDTATVTANSAATGFPASNTKTRLFLEHWRSTGLTAEWVKADLGADVVIRAVVIKYNNLRVGDSISVQAATTAVGDVWTSPTINVAITITTAMVSKGQIVYNWESAPTACRWWRVIMTSAGNSDAYIRIGRMYLGTYVEPDRDYDKDWGIKNVTPSVIVPSATGQEFVNVLPKYKQITLNFGSMSAADEAKMEALRDALGSDTAFFVELDPANMLTAWTYYVTAPSDWNIQHIFGAQLYSMPLTMKEER